MLKVEVVVDPPKVDLRYGTRSDEQNVSRGVYTAYSHAWHLEPPNMLLTCHKTEATESCVELAATNLRR